MNIYKFFQFFKENMDRNLFVHIFVSPEPDPLGVF